MGVCDEFVWLSGSGNEGMKKGVLETAEMIMGSDELKHVAGI